MTRGRFQTKIGFSERSERWLGSGTHPLDVVFYRAYDGYREVFEDVYKNEVDALTKDDLYIDVGCGLGLAPLEVAKKNVNTVGITHIDYWKEVEKLKKLGPADLDFQMTDGDTRKTLVTRIGDVSLHSIYSLNKLVKGPLEANYYVNGTQEIVAPKSGGVYSPGATAKAIHTLADKVAELKRNAPAEFRLTVGDTRTELAKHAGKAKLISDLYGDYQYDFDPASLISAYGSALAPNGKALVLAQARTAWEGLKGGPSVKTKTGDQISLHEYLASKYPQNFSTETIDIMGGFKTILTLKKGADGKFPEFNLKKVSSSKPKDTLYDTSRYILYEEG